MLQKLALLLVIPAGLAAQPAMAAGPYVMCDNGLRCFVAPCPSTNAYDINAGKLMKGVWFDLDRLAAADRDRLQDEDALFHGTRVVSGRIETRKVETLSGKRELPYLVIDGIVRTSTADEQRLCRG